MVTTEDPFHLDVLNRKGHRGFFPEGDHNSEILQEHAGNKGGYKEIAITANTHGYFPFIVSTDADQGQGEGKKKQQHFMTHRISGFFNGAENQSGLSMEEVFKTKNTVMDHRHNLKTDWSGNFYSIVPHLCNVC